ncbi:MAG: hypothetical protein BHV77_14565 [Bacteroides sp. 43_108]|nr:MAG: hypothetical protein BHV77_14565 [Bacteroides sp. 43_108]
MKQEQYAHAARARDINFEGSKISQRAPAVDSFHKYQQKECARLMTNHQTGRIKTSTMNNYV